MEDHLIFFVYAFLNTLSRIIARLVSVRLERRFYGGQKSVCQEVILDENEAEEQSEDDSVRDEG